MMKRFRIGIDAGSTTIKFVVLDVETKDVAFSSYQRHFADIRACLERQFNEMADKLGKDAEYSVCLTGSAGIGLSERSGLPFVQEVLACSAAMKELNKTDFTLIDLGGEDAKMVFFSKEKSPDIRMNGSCAGGTGAFIDQMATLLNIHPKEMSDAAASYEQLYPIASRCGVFAKTDIQNLLSRRLPLSDISASIFNAVAMQTMTTLARGADIVTPVLCTGGPLTFLPSLREAFVRVMKLNQDDLIVLPHAEITTARGAALSADESIRYSIDQIFEMLKKDTQSGGEQFLAPLFHSDEEYAEWKKNLNVRPLKYAEIREGQENEVFMGIDSGSTTTKFLITDRDGAIVFKSYANNDGNPLLKVEQALKAFFEVLKSKNATAKFLGSCVTGYGEDLIKAALNIDHGIVETMAHFKAAHYVAEDVSFILDIGGQDIKSIFIRNGAVANIELNESCSSGCGSFLQGFAGMMNIELSEFAEKACVANHPCDLGTRCTVFMNSKVKEALRQDTDPGDIAAGLAISVVKNCLYKVLKLQNLNKLGDTIVVQGGTFKNKAVLRALEILSGKQVYTTDAPELMGAYGSALYAIDQHKIDQKESTFNGEKTLETLANIVTDMVQCKGCTNNCQVVRFKFPNGNMSFAGNKCERIFHSKAKSDKQGENQIEAKYKTVFSCATTEVPNNDKLVIGIPRVLNMFENYPFWNALFKEAGFIPVLSDESNTQLYRGGIFSIMSDNICFPAKLTNGHIMNLIEKKVNRIFYPLVIMEQKEHERDANCFNCPVVSGYPDVIRSAVNPEQRYGVKFDTPVVSFKDEESLYDSCYRYLHSLGVKRSAIKRAVKKAIEAKFAVRDQLISTEKAILNKAVENGTMLFVMTGRPYHVDPLINQRVAQIVTDLGADIISDDVFREDEDRCLEMNYISQWTYPNRVVHAAHGVARLPQNVQLIQINSFGCGPDSFLMDEASNILNAAGKNHTVIRVDEISSPGSVRLRLRSLIESLKQSNALGKAKEAEGYKALHNSFTEKEKREKTILIPWFSDSLSPLFPAFFKRLGFNMMNMPKPDEESIQYGLKYGHNEVCYPATLVLGDIMKFLFKHKEERDKYVVGITQTGGQCRATNYLALIKNALVTAGFSDMSVVSLNTGTAYGNEQPAFTADAKLAFSLAFKILHFTESIAAMHRAMVVREKVKGTSKFLMDKYLDKAIEYVEAKKEDKLIKLLEEAVEEYNNMPTNGVEPRVVGLIGEIYIKYNSFGQLHIGEWLQERGIEVVVPSIFSFLLQFFVNDKVNHKNGIERTSFISRRSQDLLRLYVSNRDRKWERVNKKFKYYRPESNIFEQAKDASTVINLVNQFGEGWLIAGEVMELSRMNINKVVCLQPFGCIANHIVARGIENRLRKACPQTGMLFLDIDSSVAKVNLENRLHFLVDQMEQEEKERGALA
ncbi:MAG: acyl-CoA dehydratase activase-related protein [Bacteroidales bacterium]|nr:acyl-CoA dehydratase activase-related protein [Bacteroidales bacterium]